MAVLMNLRNHRKKPQVSKFQLLLNALSPFVKCRFLLRNVVASASCFLRKGYSSGERIDFLPFRPPAAKPGVFSIAPCGFPPFLGCQEAVEAAEWGAKRILPSLPALFRGFFPTSLFASSSGSPRHPAFLLR